MSLSTTFTKLKKEIADIISQSPYEEDIPHSLHVWGNVMTLKPDADEALQIAALAHDIERAVPERIKIDNFKTRDAYKAAHAKRSAKITAELLIKHRYDTKIVDKVKKLISNHEIGGSGDIAILTEADTLAFFQEHINPYVDRFDTDRVKKKISYMYQRLSKEGQQMLKRINFSSKVQKLIDETIKS